MSWRRAPLHSTLCSLVLSLTAAIEGCGGPMVFENAGSPNTFEQDQSACQLLQNTDPFAQAYARDPLGNMGYPIMVRRAMKQCMERKGWRQIGGEDQVKKPDIATGSNLVSEQDQLLEREKSLTGTQGKAGPAYERQIEVDKLLAKSSEKQEQDKARSDKQKVLLDLVYEDILQRGHDIVIGEPEANQHKEMANLSFPVVIKTDPIISSKIYDLNQNGFGKELSDRTYKNFEQRLDNLYFSLELVLGEEKSLGCYASKNLTQYETDGEFLSVNDKPSTWNISISVPIQTAKRMTGVRGRFIEGRRGSVCGVVRINK